jgi:hypothetical protein
MQSASPFQPYPSTASADAESSRQLNDEVLQSAEEAVLIETAEPDGVFPTTASRQDGHGLDASPASSAYKNAKNAVGQFVAAKPSQSALMAVAVGALAAMVLRSRLRKRAASSRWTRLR